MGVDISVDMHAVSRRNICCPGGVIRLAVGSGGGGSTCGGPRTQIHSTTIQQELAELKRDGEKVHGLTSSSKSAHVQCRAEVGASSNSRDEAAAQQQQ